MIADVDECDLGLDECSENANCSDTIGSYNCTCRTGFDGDGFSCTGNQYLLRSCYD